MSILTIQSHVSYGHVGNSIAVFPLQRLGYEVWPVQTVLFSNHAGYPSFTGPVLQANDVADVVSGIKARGAFPSCEAVLSGYLGSHQLGEVVLDTVYQVKSENPKALYCCDPVMGDRGKGIYVQSDIPDFMRHEAVPLSDILIPNHFELELLVGEELKDVASAVEAARGLLRSAQKSGPEIIIVTSFEADDDKMTLLGITAKAAWMVQTPKLPFNVPPSGAGDLSAALFFAGYLTHQQCDLAMSTMVSSVYSLLSTTLERGEQEIALIKGQEKIISPDYSFHTQPI